MLRILPLIILLTASTVYADHAIFNATASSASANTALQFEQQVGRYEVGDDLGEFSVSYLQVEFALLERLSVMAGAPWVTLMPRESRSLKGIGDSMAGLKYQLTPSGAHGLGTSLGLNVELPTGDAVKRIGGDHYGVEAAFAVAKSLSSELKIISRLSHSFAPGHSHGSEHGPEQTAQVEGGVIRPHGEQESTALISLVHATEQQFIEMAARGGVAFDHDESYMTPLDLILRAGFNIGKRTTVVSSFTQTVGGEVRAPWTLSLGFTVNYERHTHSHEEDHHEHHDHEGHDHPHAHD